MNLFYLDLVARTLDLVGKVLVSYMAIRVHHRVWKDHKIDEGVFSVMKLEQKLGYLGIVFIVFAYVFEAFILVNYSL